MPSANQLARHRTVLATSLVDTCTIQRRASVSDGKGGRTTSYSDFATLVACRVAPSGGAEQVIGGKVTPVFDAIVTFVNTQDVVATDRIVWNSRTFEVTLVRPRTTQISLRVEAKEIK